MDFLYSLVQSYYRYFSESTPLPKILYSNEVKIVLITLLQINMTVPHFATYIQNGRILYIKFLALFARSTQIMERPRRGFEGGKNEIFFERRKSLKLTDGGVWRSSLQVGARGEPDTQQNRQSHNLNTLRLKLTQIRTCAGNAVCCFGRIPGISIKNLHSRVEVLLGKLPLFSL
jgi:hypothetical protein